MTFLEYLLPLMHRERTCCLAWCPTKEVDGNVYFSGFNLFHVKRQFRQIVQPDYDIYYHLMGASLGKIKFNLEREAWPYPPLSEQAVDIGHPFTGNPLTEIPANFMQFNMYRLSGALISTEASSGKSRKGSAILISPNMVLTVAHNIYDVDSGQTFREIKFYPGLKGMLEKVAVVSDFFYPPEYRLDPSTENDWALLKLSQNIEENEFLPLLPDVDGMKANAKFTIIGYPSEKYHRMASLRTQSVSPWADTKLSHCIEHLRVEKGEIVHSISAMKGQDGAPIICVDKKRDSCIIAIHRGGLVRGRQGKSSSNCGRLMTESFIKILQKCTIQLKGLPFPTRFLSASQIMKEVGSAHVGSKIDQIKELVRQANFLMQASKEEEAIPLLKKVLELNPQQPNVLSSLAIINYKSENVDEALKYLRVLYRLNPQNYATVYLTGSCLVLKQLFHEALYYFNEALRLPGHIKKDIFSAIGCTHYNMKQYDLAIKNQLKALEVSPKSLMSILAVAFTYQAMEKGEEAMCYFKKAIEVDGKCYEAMAHILVLLQKEEKYEETLTATLEYCEKCPQQDVIMGTLAICFSQTKKVKEGVQRVKEIIDRPGVKSPYIHLSLAELLFEDGQYDEAIGQVKHVQPLAADERLYHILGERFMVNQERLSLAELCFKKALELNPQNEIFMELLGTVSSVLGKGNEGLLLFQEAVKKNPESFICWAQLGKQQSLLNKDEESLHSFKKAIELNPESRDILINLGSLYGRSKPPQANEALDCFMKAEKLGVATPTLYSFIAVAYNMLEQHEQSMRYYQKALNKDPKNIVALNGLTQGLINTYQLAEAERYVMKVLEIEPENVQSIHHYGVVCENTMRVDEAIKFFEKAIEINKEVAVESYVGLGRIYFQKEDIKTAKEYFQQVQAAKAQDPMFCVLYGSILGMLDQKQDCLKYLLKSIRSGHADANTYLMAGVILVEIEEPLKAIKYLQKMIRIQKKSDQLHFTLGRAFWMIGQEKKAIDSFAIAFELNPFDEDNNTRMQYYRKEFERRKGL